MLIVECLFMSEIICNVCLSVSLSRRLVSPAKSFTSMLLSEPLYIREYISILSSITMLSSQNDKWNNVSYLFITTQPN